MYRLVIAAGFWLLVVHAAIAGANRRVVAAFAAAWIGAFLVARFFPVLSPWSSVAHAILLVAMAVWLKASGDL
ncbi:MAG TPA: hypothetical protein VGF28_01210 [Thermoanaerobaculia bacterium]